MRHVSIRLRIFQSTTRSLLYDRLLECKIKLDTLNEINLIAILA